MHWISPYGLSECLRSVPKFNSQNLFKFDDTSQLFRFRVRHDTQNKFDASYPENTRIFPKQ